MNVVLTGTTGKLGGFLRRHWAGVHRVHCLTREVADLRDPEALRRVLEEMSFDALVSCAAMTSPEACEADPAGADVVNGEAPAVMAAVCRERGARLLHFSTDYVLDGTEPGLKDEQAVTNPLNHYGRSKLDGECRVLDECPMAMVCRVSWLFGTTPPGFVQTVVGRAKRGEKLDLVADKWSMPSSVADIAQATDRLLNRPDLAGVIHLTNLGEEESWWSYGKKVLQIARELGILDRDVMVHPAKLADIPQLSTPRPLHTAMIPARMGHELGWTPRCWEEAAREVLRAQAELQD